MFDMVIHTAIPACNLHTDSPEIAMSFLLMLRHVIQPEAFVATVIQHIPGALSAAHAIAKACVGVAV